MKYKVGTKVYHLAKATYAHILEYIGEGRYYIRHSGHIWSVPESDLRSKKPPTSRHQ